MDRREALRKLGIAGAVAAGGSVVLSSNAVAAAFSGNCVTIPDTVTLSITYSAQTAAVTPSGLPAGVSSYLWSATKIGNQAVVVASGFANVNPTRLERRSSLQGTLKNWEAGDTYDVTLSLQWDCAGASDNATFVGRAQYNSGTVTANRTVPA